MKVRLLLPFLLFVLGVPLLATPAPAAGAFCSLSGMTTFLWDGEAGDGEWTTPLNWSDDTVPGQNDGATGYVCLPGGAVVSMEAGARADLQAVDVASGASLLLETGSKIFVQGPPDTRASVIRQDAVVHLLGTLGGPGRWELGGLMEWTSTGFGASTVTTRNCSLGPASPEPGDDDDPDGCAGPVPGDPGTLVVLDSGRLVVGGRGVNLFDQYRLQVRGVMLLDGEGYVAADRGTALALLPHTDGTGAGRFEIRNDGGIYEGRTTNGITGLATFSNGGTVTKRAGAGTSVIVGDYTTSSARGKVAVRSGLLSLPADVPDTLSLPAAVAAGAAYGVGSCEQGGSYGCTPVTEGSVVQAGALKVPMADADGSRIHFYRQEGGPAWRLGKVMRIHAADLEASARRPAIMSLRFDSSLLGGRRSDEVDVFRRADGSRRYRRVPDCTGRGRPPAGAVACVDRRDRPGSSRDVLDAGDSPGDPVDALMVVRTTGTSRWVGR